MDCLVCGAGASNAGGNHPPESSIWRGLSCGACRTAAAEAWYNPANDALYEPLCRLSDRLGGRADLPVEIFGWSWGLRRPGS
jgi:hypothetical protein